MHQSTTSIIPNVFGEAMVGLIEKYQPEGILIGATNNGRDLGRVFPAGLKPD